MHRHGDYVSLERELLDSQKNRQLEIKEEIKTARSRNEVSFAERPIRGDRTEARVSKSFLPDVTPKTVVPAPFHLFPCMHQE